MQRDKIMKRAEATAAKLRDRWKTCGDCLCKDAGKAIMALLGLISQDAQPNEPLTLEELREMDGKPAWSEDLQCWGLVSVEREGAWGGIPFLECPQNGRIISYYIQMLGYKLYRRPPEEATT